jgi:hypothetical protein
VKRTLCEEGSEMSNRSELVLSAALITYIYIYIYIYIRLFFSIVFNQSSVLYNYNLYIYGVPEGKDLISGECSLDQTIPM